MIVKYFIYYFDDGYAYFGHTFNDLRKTDILLRYKTTSILYNTFITQKVYRPITLLSEVNIEPSCVIPEGLKILKSLSIPAHKLIYQYK